VHGRQYITPPNVSWLFVTCGALEGKRRCASPLLDVHVTGGGDDQAVDMTLAPATDPKGLVVASALHVGRPVRLLTRSTLPHNQHVGRHHHHIVPFFLRGGPRPPRPGEPHPSDPEGQHDADHVLRVGVQPNP
jgi:hypothetical protein